MIFIFTDRENVEKISFTVSEKVENFHFPSRVKKSVNYRDFHCQGKSIIINNTFCRGRGSPTESILNNDAHEEVQT